LKETRLEKLDSWPRGYIARHLSVVDFLAVRQVSKKWCKCFDHENVWQYFCQAHWPNLPKVQGSWKKLGWSVINLVRGRLYPSSGTWSPTHYRWKVVDESEKFEYVYRLYRADMESKEWVFSGFESEHCIYMASRCREGLKADPILVTHINSHVIIGYETSHEKLWEVKSPMTNKDGEVIPAHSQMWGSGFLEDRPVFSVCWTKWEGSSRVKVSVCVYGLLAGKLLHQIDLAERFLGGYFLGMRGVPLRDGSLGIFRPEAETWWRFDGSEWKVLESREADAKNGSGGHWFHAVKADCMEVKIRHHPASSQWTDLPEELEWIGLDWKGKRTWTWHAPYSICYAQFGEKRFLAFSVLEGFKVTRRLPITTFRKSDRWEYFCTCPPDDPKTKPIRESNKGKIEKTGSCVIQ